MTQPVGDANVHGRRVVVTGLGLVCSLGNSVEEVWRRLLAGKSGAASITQFDASGFPVRFACEVHDFDAGAYIDARAARRMDRCSHFAIAAARQAESDAGLDAKAVGERGGVAIGSALGGVASFERAVLQVANSGPSRLNPFALVQTLPNLPAGWVSIELGLRGPVLAQSTACAAAAMAIGEGLDAIRLGRVDVMFCGGTEAPITPTSVAGFSAMRALSTRNEDPDEASRPFDRDRDGFVIAEGAAVLVLEELEHARRRGARIYAEVLGYGISSDAHHVSDPDPDGSNPARALRMAFADAGIEEADVGYVNAHGTSTPAGDRAEARVLQLVLGPDLVKRVPVSSTKGATGHTLGAAGAIEAVFTALAVQNGVLPPTINQFEPDPECELMHVSNTPRVEQVDVALSNSFGFGGHNTALLIGRWPRQAH